tara:strand:- start:1301 stop:2038 length:738 start_codon:yes stop_codon:yes gene_type:complete
MKNLTSIMILSMLPLCLVACDWYPTEEQWGAYVDEVIESEVDLSKVDSTYTSGEKAAAHAYKQTVQNTVYDGSWVNIGYPGGDPGYQQGVCTDVVIRALRFIDIDLQELIYKDMQVAHDEYNKRYRTKKLDNNIDHRRTQNIQTFLTRMGAKVKTYKNLRDSYQPGDIVFWDIAAGHTGIVSNEMAPNGYYKVIHNIGGGAQKEELLSNWIPIEVYRLTESNVIKLSEACAFKYDENKDFKRYVQ